MFKFFDNLPIRIRLSFGHAMWMALLFVAMGGGVYRAVEDSIMQSFDTTLLTSAKTVRESRLHNSDTNAKKYSRMNKWERVLEALIGDSKTPIKPYAQLVDTSGKVRVKTGNVRVRLPVTQIAVTRAEKGLETFENFRLSNKNILRQVTLPVELDGVFTGELIQVGGSLSPVLHTMKNLKEMLLFCLTIGLVLSILFGILLTKGALQPVDQVIKVVTGISKTEDYTSRVSLPQAKDELWKLSVTFNKMIDTVEQGFFRLRRFTGDVSHELRTPLAIIKGEAELSLRRERTVEEYKESLRFIHSEASLMTRMVEDLLLLARAQGNAISISKTKEPLSAFVSGLEKQVSVSFQSKKIKLVTKIETSIESIECGKTYIEIALVNILLNACKHSSEGGNVEFRVYKKVNKICFLIKDYGEGIPEKSLPAIFETFYRADSSRNRSTGGVGIGLSLAKALVDIHQGTINVVSKEGEGSTFEVELPY
jgi:signal transduction histidine kinase